jgi:hypothetical protein
MTGLLHLLLVLFKNDSLPHPLYDDMKDVIPNAPLLIKPQRMNKLE